MGYHGKVCKPVRLTCLVTHGAPPSDQHRAAHTCGRGNKGCVNPRHIVWKTQSECRLDELRDGRRKAYGKGGKITPTEADEIRALKHIKSPSEIGLLYGLSDHRIGEILNGKAHIAQRTYCPRGGRFYPKLVIRGHSYSLGGFATAKQAASAYEAARLRVRRGEPVLLPATEKPSLSDVRRWYQPPAQSVNFGDREGELIVAVEAVQEQSTFLMHHALERLNPSVRKFIVAASETGDLLEAAQAAGLNQDQVAILLPRLRLFLSPILAKTWTQSSGRKQATVALQPQAIPVVFDLVQPVLARGDAGGLGGEAKL